MDESERRNQSRRTNDIVDVSEMRLLRHELQTLREDLDREEAADHKRLVALEAEVAEFKRKFAVGRGFFYGVIAVLGSVGVYVVDHLKEIFQNFKV